MNATSPPTAPPFASLLRGELPALRSWTAHWRTPNLLRDCTFIIAGAGAFGLAIGWWRAPEQALYAAIKLPLIMLLTAAGNGLLNAMLAPLLGLQIAFRQSFLAILTSFALAAAILGAMSPLAAFVIWNAPPLTPGANNSETHAGVLLLLVATIAFAGIAANLRLWQLLRHLAGQPTAAWRVLLAWLAGNLFLGSQLSWILRPFIGSPGLPVQFLRADAFNGNFFETVLRSGLRLFN
ncbi:MAG: hypothetical protein QM813_12725 [Verrucomicrobiota bacterium]